MAEIKKEEAQYVDLPKIYAFKDAPSEGSHAQP